MNSLFTMILNAIYYVGESTVSVISRCSLYEPEEDIILSEMMEHREE
ncbi:MAG: hypothetical protein NC341_02185 [Blautia sp.]|nr:hypothetical protein [Blautia sp.]MCM1200426.1 hypothetical protein [Bacteroides fragilis]